MRRELDDDPFKAAARDMTVVGCAAAAAFVFFVGALFATGIL